MTYTEDSLRVSENDDGTLAIEWDPNDPKYAIFNSMTQDELQDYITKALEQFIAEHESNYSGS
jgi:hexokinase